MRKRCVGLVRSGLAILLLGVWGPGARAEEEAVPPTSDLEQAIQTARARLEQIDSRMAALEDEEQTLMGQARETHQEQFEYHRKLTEGDEELRSLMEQVEAAQRELHDRQEALSRRMSEHSNYVALTTRQTAILERSGAIQRERMQLANDRVQSQIHLKALEQQQAAQAEGDAPESGNADPTLSAEEPEPL